MSQTPEQRQNLKDFVEHLSRSIRPLICGMLVENNPNKNVQGCCLLAEVNEFYGFPLDDDDKAYGLFNGEDQVTESLSESKFGIPHFKMYALSDKYSGKGVKMVRDLAPLVVKEFLSEEQ